MRCIILFCILLSLLWVPIYSTAPEEMTDAEIVAELIENLEKREAILTEREADLNRREELLQQKEQLLSERESALTQRLTWQSEIENYWKNYKSESEKQIRGSFLRGLFYGATAGTIAALVFDY